MPIETVEEAVAAKVTGLHFAAAGAITRAVCVAEVFFLLCRGSALRSGLEEDPRGGRRLFRTGDTTCSSSEAEDSSLLDVGAGRFLDELFRVLRLTRVFAGLLLVLLDRVDSDRVRGFLEDVRADDLRLRLRLSLSLSPSEEDPLSLESLLSEALLSVHALLTLLRDSALLASLKLSSLSWPLSSPPLPLSFIRSTPFFSAALHMERDNLESKSANCTTIVSGALNVRQFCQTSSTSFLNNPHF